MKLNSALKISVYLKLYLPVVITCVCGEGEELCKQLVKALQICLHPVWFPDDVLFIVYG